MAEEQDSFFTADTRKISKKELRSLASKSKTKFKTKFYTSKKTISSGKPLSEQAKALLEKHSDDPSARFRFTKSWFITVRKRTRTSSSSSSISSSSSSSSSKTATTAAAAELAKTEAAWLADSETAASPKMISWDNCTLRDKQLHQCNWEVE